MTCYRMLRKLYRSTGNDGFRPLKHWRCSFPRRWPLIDPARASKSVTVGDIRRRLQSYESIRFSRPSINKQLKEVLPVNDSLDAETVRHHLHKATMRQDEQLKDQPRFISGCQNQWATLPRPGKPLTVGIDGGYIRDYNNRKTNFEVIVAKSFSDTEASRRLGFVQTLDANPQRRMMLY